MNVKFCEGCKFYERRRWIQRHVPADYHAVGFVHAFAFCLKNNDSCLNVKNCDSFESIVEEGDRIFG